MQVNSINPTTEIKQTALQKTEMPVVEKKAPEVVTEKIDKPEEKTENLNKMKEVLAENNISLKFRQDSETKALIVELVNDKTGEAIRQIPSEISIKLAAAYVKMQGQFVDEMQ